MHLIGLTDEYLERALFANYTRGFDIVIYTHKVLFHFIDILRPPPAVLPPSDQVKILSFAFFCFFCLPFF